MQGGLPATLLSIMMIAVFLLAAGGLWTIFRLRDVRKGILMLVAGLVFLANVLILTL